MKIALTDHQTGEVHTLTATIRHRVGYSRRGHLQMILEHRPEAELTWEEWQEHQGVLVAVTGAEKPLFEQWYGDGSAYSDFWRRLEA